MQKGAKQKAAHAKGRQAKGRPCNKRHGRPRNLATRWNAEPTLVVDRLLLEVALRMVADGAKLGSRGANMQVAAVQALPNLDALALEDLALLNALGELKIALLVRLLHRANALELGGNLLEASSSAVCANSAYIVVHS
mgnify:CR=1 FL=1